MPDYLHTYGVILNAVIPVFLLIGLGAFLRWVKVLSHEADKSLLRLSMHVLTPCLVFTSIIGAEPLRDSSHIILPPLIGFGFIASALLIGWGGGYIAGFWHDKSHCTFSATVGMHNYGYLAIPIITSIYGGDKEVLGVNFVFFVGVEFALWTLVIIVLTGGEVFSDWKKLLTGSIVSIPLALLLNAFYAETWIPEAVQTTYKTAGACAIPLGVILVGAVFYDAWRGDGPTFKWRPTLTACVFRMAIIPLILLGVMLILPLSDLLKKVIAVQLAMPCAIFPLVLSKHYEADPKTAAMVIFSTSFLGLLTIPLVLQLTMDVLGVSGSALEGSQ